MRRIAAGAVAITVLLLIHLPSWAEEKVQLEEVVVTASKIEEPAEETTSSVIVVTEEEIENTNEEFVPEVLNRIADLNIVQSGGTGKSAGIFLRGATPSQTVVMIDGVKVKSTTLGEFDLSGVTTDDIERIEIVKGPQSTMYGSEAMGGVVNIITKKGKGKPKIGLSYGYGTHDTQDTSASLSGGSEAFDYRVSASYFETDGISVLKDTNEPDGYENASVSGKFGIKPTKNTGLELTGKYYANRNEIDTFNGDDTNRVQHDHGYLISVRGSHIVTAQWEQMFTASRVWDLSRTRDPDPADSIFADLDVKSEIDTVDWQHNFYISEPFLLTVGAEYREESGDSENRDLSGNTVEVFDESIDNKALYANSKLKSGEFTFNAGVRYDDHETFGEETTYRIGVVQAMKKERIRARLSYSTGFRAPTLNDLFFQDPFGNRGNPDLKPETSKSWEVGLEQDLSDAATVSVTYFQQEYEDLIEWVQVMPFVWQPENVSEAEVRGVETSAAYRTPTFGVKAAYTYLDSEDKKTGERLTRRPIDKLVLSVDFTVGRFFVLADYIYVGKVFDGTVFPTGQNLGSYNIVDVSGRFAISKNFSLFARVDNLLDEEYEEAGGFNTPGTSIFGGIKVVF